MDPITLTSGTRPPHGRSLLGALAYHGLPSIEAAEKQGMLELAMRGGPFDADERAAVERVLDLGHQLPDRGQRAVVVVARRGHAAPRRLAAVRVQRGDLDSAAAAVILGRFLAGEGK